MSEGEYFRENIIELNQIKIGLEQHISPELMNTRVEVERDQLYEFIRVRVTGYVFSENLKRYEYKWPRDWWQAFKKRWFPEWLLKKYPVDYELHVLDIKAIYPDLHKRVSVPPNMGSYRIKVMTS